MQKAYPQSNRALKDGIGPYKIPHIRVTSTLVYTNKLFGCPYRGLGIAESVWANESRNGHYRRSLTRVGIRCNSGSRAVSMRAMKPPPQTGPSTSLYKECIRKVSAAAQLGKKT